MGNVVFLRTMSAKIINGRKIASEIRKELAKQVTGLEKKYKITPTIATVKIGDDPNSALYLKLRDNACEEVGIHSHHIDFDHESDEKEVMHAIARLNADRNIHGILIQYPVPPHCSPQKLMSAIDPKKDVEGFHPINMGKTMVGDESLVPCTPLSVLAILNHEQIDLQGKEIVIVNHSNIVGKPLSILFLNRNATVSICHIFTKDITPFTKKADILITATGVRNLITGEYIKANAFIIDVGIIQTDDGICGDVDFNSVKEKAGWITPVPGGVGPVTIACCLRNMIKTYTTCVAQP